MVHGYNQSHALVDSKTLTSNLQTGSSYNNSDIILWCTRKRFWRAAAENIIVSYYYNIIGNYYYNNTINVHARMKRHIGAMVKWGCLSSPRNLNYFSTGANLNLYKILT